MAKSKNFGGIREERAGIVINDFTVTVFTEDGKEIVKTVEDVESSAIVLDNELVFVTKDPKVFITLDEPVEIRSVVITANVLSKIPQEYIDRTRQKFEMLRQKEIMLQHKDLQLESMQILLDHARRPIKQKIIDKILRRN